jgi:hypothetical protein
MIVPHGIDSSMVHRRQGSFWESSRFDCSEAASRIRPFGVDDGRIRPSKTNSTEGPIDAFDYRNSCSRVETMGIGR